SPLAKIAGVGYPLLTTLVVLGTANHYLLDAVAGAAVMGIGLLLARPALRLADRLPGGGAPMPSRIAAEPADERAGPSADGTVAALVSGGCQTSTVDCSAP